MAYEISTQLSQMPTAPTLAEGGTPAFDEKAFPFVGAWTTIYGELNQWSAQANALAAWLESQVAGIDVDAVSAVAELAYVSANFGGEWNAADDFAGMACTKGCLVYASAIPAGGANVGNDPETDDGTYWVRVSKTAPIDEQLRNQSVTGIDYDETSGLMTTITYVDDYTETFTWATGAGGATVLQSAEYKDAEDTLLLTVTYDYDAQDNMTGATRS